MEEFQKKIKHLTHTMIVWAENNKIKKAADHDYSIPSRNGVEWKDDFEYVTKLDSMMSDGVYINKDEMKTCNMLYRYYK